MDHMPTDLVQSWLRASTEREATDAVVDMACHLRQGAGTYRHDVTRRREGDGRRLKGHELYSVAAE